MQDLFGTRVKKTTVSSIENLSIEAEKLTQYRDRTPTQEFVRHSVNRIRYRDLRGRPTANIHRSQSLPVILMVTDNLHSNWK